MRCQIRRCALCAGCTEFHHNPSLGDPPKAMKKNIPRRHLGRNLSGHFGFPRSWISRRTCRGHFPGAMS